MTECNLCYEYTDPSNAIRCDLGRCEMAARPNYWEGVVNKELCPVCRRSAKMRYGTRIIHRTFINKFDIIKAETFELLSWIPVFIIGIIIIFEPVLLNWAASPQNLNDCGGKSPNSAVFSLDQILICRNQPEICRAYKCNLECYDVEEKLCYNKKHHAECQKMTVDYARSTTLTSKEQEIFYSMCRKIVSFSERNEAEKKNEQFAESQSNGQSPLTTMNKSCMICEKFMGLVDKVDFYYVLLALYGLFSTLFSWFMH